MKRFIQSLSFALMLIVGFLSGAVLAHETGNIHVEGAWARAAAVTGGNGAGFFVIENHTSSDDVLLRVEADVSNIVELHTMTMDNNIMRMRKLDAVPVPANSDVTFAPGGDHVMFIGLKAPLKDGEKFPITLVFKNAGEIKTEVQILKNAPKGSDSHSH